MAGKFKIKKWIILILGILLIPPIIFVLTVWILFSQQDSLVQDQLAGLNKGFQGAIEIRDSHVSPFERFPYVSVEVDDLVIHEFGDLHSDTVLNIEECYLGFDLWTILEGKYEVKEIELKGGKIFIRQDTMGNMNITNAFLPVEEDTSSTESEFDLDIKSIELIDLRLDYENQASNLFVSADIRDAESMFKTVKNHITFNLESDFELSVIQDSIPTIIYEKHIQTHTRLDFIQDEQVLLIKPSTISLDHGDFSVVGKIDMDNDMELDLQLSGEKPNFDLVLSFAPEDLATTLSKYDNEGKIFFDAKIQGKMANGNTPFVEANFGCEEAFFENTTNESRLNDLFFKGHFTNGEKRDLTTTEFSLVDFSARPEAGTFKGFLKVKNFDSPEIDMKLSSNFDLEFLADFFNIRDLEELDGNVDLTMNFRDIIDLDSPERALEQFNQSYFTELLIEDLSFKAPGYHLKIDDIDLKASMEGNKAQIDYFNLKVGKSDLKVTASIDDLPSIIHHTDIPVTSRLHFQSNHFDLTELTSFDTANFKPIDEQVDNFNMKLRFKSSARAFTNSPNLPIGQFFIDDLFAKFKHYPHTLHNFKADVFIEEKSMRVINLEGMIDSSDFSSSGICQNYDLWFADEKVGGSKIFFYLKSNSIKFKDLFTYEGVNYVPEEYRHEEVQNFQFKGYARLKFDQELTSTDVFIQYIRGKMKVHPMKLDRFGGRFEFRDDLMTITNLNGKLGDSQFLADMTYYLGDNPKHKKKNSLKFTSKYLNFDQLMKYNPPPPVNVSNTQAHEEAWSIYQVPFPDMSYSFQIDHMHYKKKNVENMLAEFRTMSNQTLFFDTLKLETAGGRIFLKGVFSGANPKVIFLKPTLTLDNLDLDELLLRYENLGQDHLVSENINGRFSGEITGLIRLYPDMTPKIDESQINMDISVVGGQLEHYSALEVLSEYFKDKNLAKVIFDTLQNSIQMKNGTLIIPNMTINSSLGFIELSGKQDMDLNMEYYMRIPWKMVTKAAWHRLFKKDEDIPEDQIDEIEYKEEGKRIRYLNVKISGTPDDYEISLEKDKKQ